MGDFVRWAAEIIAVLANGYVSNTNTSVSAARTLRVTDRPAKWTITPKSSNAMPPVDPNPCGMEPGIYVGESE